MSILTAQLNRRTFVGLAALLAAGCVRNSPTGRLRLAAGDPGGLYLAFAQIIAERVQARYPNLVVDVISTEGSVQNLARLRAGEVDMGLTLADVAERDRATGPKATAPQAVARVYENYLQVLVPKSSAMQHVSDFPGQRVSIGPTGSGAAATGTVLFDASGLRGRVEIENYRLRDGLANLADGRVEAMVWSGGVPTPAIADLHNRVPLRMLDIGALAAPMSELAGYPYTVRFAPSGSYVPPGTRTIGVSDLLLCRNDIASDSVAAVVDVLANDAPQLIPPGVRGLQYLDAPSMIQTGAIPLHPGAVDAYRALHG
ncbi:immunogenic protein [Mycolicibacterium conceptionense]|uniref:Immunogenic protein n=1 Tax=Mycolicibacterium conceptionense TaxID=451644 RepID=A0A0U1DXS5_9MYCO|nr:TAXI family TRAP transporter solute-binding subunit [Mycolicibacterium conceptionense]ORV29423.1 TRAP ABC transporter substrate-binding protein [Mycolicibacterium conceptionense]CQD24801.1 immunogenic protein [Mycolicibacterium conceptionense]